MTRSSSPSPATAPPPRDTARALEDLHGSVRDLIAEHDLLTDAVAAQRAALAAADVGGLSAAIVRQGESAQRIAQIERRRIAAVAVLAPPARAGSRAEPARVRLTELAATLPEPARHRLLEAAAALKAVLERLHREYAVLREAATQLAAHLEGITRQVYAKLSHTGTYARSGALGTHAQVVSSLDVRM